MSVCKELGKIESVKFGYCGYQNAMLGIEFYFSMSGAGSGDSKCFWDSNLIERDEHTKWTEDARSKAYDNIMRYISDLLRDAKVDSVDKLKGVPVEIEFEDMALKHWRILTEVL